MPGLADPVRARLVGLRPAGAVKQLTAGAHLFEPVGDTVPENDIGWVSSVAFSPTLGHMIGLAFVQNADGRMGGQVRMVDHLRDIETTVEFS